MGNYRVSSVAETEIAEILIYIANDNATAAFALETRLTSIFEMIAENPNVGRLRPQLQEGIRSIAFGNYLVLYRLWAREVAIVRVLHGSRDLEAIFREEK